MLKSEFIERTGYTPIEAWSNGYTNLSEYDYIERAYWDFGGNKDEFCRECLNDFKSGAWAKQLKLMKRMDSLSESYRETIREQYKTIRELENKLDRIQSIINQ